jgi:hypothetical protein
MDEACDVSKGTTAESLAILGSNRTGIPGMGVTDQSRAAAINYYSSVAADQTPTSTSVRKVQDHASNPPSRDDIEEQPCMSGTDIANSFDEPERPTGKSTRRSEFQSSSIRRRSPQSVQNSSSANSSDDDAVNTTDESLDNDSPNTIISIDAQKEAILDRLMVYFHQIFAAAGDSTHRGERDGTPSKPPKQKNDLPHCPSTQVKGKRKSGDRDEGNHPDEDDEDFGRKRPRKQMFMAESAPESAKRLACPYFKRKPSRYQSRRTCSGPGWRTVHRLK